MARLEGKRALVTGASSGIGRETALRCAREGASVGLLGRDREALEEVSREIGEMGGVKSMVLVADVTDRGACELAVDRCVSALGGLDIQVNAAGIIGTGSLESTTPQTWREMMAVNLDAVYDLMQIALPHLKASKGSIVNVSSVTGLRAFPGVLAYCVSKAGVDQLTRCVALEVAADGVRVNAVNPGVVVTNLHRRGGMDEAGYAAFLEHSRETHPLGRPGTPGDIADAVVYLASEESRWVTGVTLSIDGGRQLTCAR